MDSIKSQMESTLSNELVRLVFNLCTQSYPYHIPYCMHTLPYTLHICYVDIQSRIHYQDHRDAYTTLTAKQKEDILISAKYKDEGELLY